MTWTTARSELRTLLSDNTNDKPRNRKPILDKQDGVNQTFTTFETRRITDFTLATTGFEGVFVNGSRATVTADDLIAGQFTLAVAPADTDTVEASYYLQWFLDSELDTFLKSAAPRLSPKPVTTARANSIMGGS